MSASAGSKSRSVVVLDAIENGSSKLTIVSTESRDKVKHRSVFASREKCGSHPGGSKMKDKQRKNQNTKASESAIDPRKQSRKSGTKGAKPVVLQHTFSTCGRCMDCGWVCESVEHWEAICCSRGNTSSVSETIAALCAVQRGDRCPHCGKVGVQQTGRLVEVDNTIIVRVDQGAQADPIAVDQLRIGGKTLTAVAALVHEGENNDRGHWVCVKRTSHGWLRCDDLVVTPCDALEMSRGCMFLYAVEGTAESQFALRGAASERMEARASHIAGRVKPARKRGHPWRKTIFLPPVIYAFKRTPSLTLVFRFCGVLF